MLIIESYPLKYKVLADFRLTFPMRHWTKFYFWWLEQAIASTHTYRVHNRTLFFISSPHCSNSSLTNNSWYSYSVQVRPLNCVWWNWFNYPKICEIATFVYKVAYCQKHIIRNDYIKLTSLKFTLHEICNGNQACFMSLHHFCKFWTAFKIAYFTCS